MKFTQLTRIRVLAVLALLTNTGAHADVMYARLGGAAVYDATTNLSWVSNANLAATNNFGVSGIDSAGRMTWITANSWIAGMNAANYLGYHDWIMPTTPQLDPTCSAQSSDTSSGFNCSGSQMGNLFYNALGGVVYQDITTTHNTNYNLFSNVQSYYYWSGTTYTKYYSDVSWYFYFPYGQQATAYWSNTLDVWAVRAGDVGGSSGGNVPEPASVALLGIGLLGLRAARRRKQPA